MMKYKGYLGEVSYDSDARILHGEVIGLKDVITFQGKTVNELEKESYLSAVELGFKGSQEEWVAEYGGNLRKMVGLPVEEGKTTTEKHTEEEVNKRIRSFYNEAVQGGYKGTLNEWKEEFPKIVEMANKPIEKIVKKKEPKEKTEEKKEESK